ncbi:MAG: hypothetical protein WCJ30_06005 [Deltaproteobacteria bacterium]
MLPTDTEPGALRAQLEALRRLGAEGRLRLGVQMCDDARQIAFEGIRRRHPEYSDEQVKREFFGIVLGEQLASRAWPAKL